MLKNWDFLDQTSNATTPQINRQKSARNLKVIALDRDGRSGLFRDVKKSITGKCTLDTCDCDDFNLVGGNPRKTFKPCMHIYRLAMELGCLQAQYEDRKSKEHKIVLLKEAENHRLHKLPTMPGHWGKWNPLIHESGIQKNRQYRAYLTLQKEPGSVSGLPNKWTIHEYEVTLDDCSCEDFICRRLPCKHIYMAAIKSGIGLPLTLQEANAASLADKENVFRFEEEAPPTTTR